MNNIRARAPTQGLHMIALALGWGAGRVKTVALRHGIEIAGDTPVAIEAVAPSPVPKPKEVSVPAPPVRRTRTKRNAAVKDHPRVEYTTVALSKAAMEALAKERLNGGKSIAGTVGIVVDYAARNGKIGALLKATLREMASQ